MRNFTIEVSFTNGEYREWNIKAATSVKAMAKAIKKAEKLCTSKLTQVCALQIVEGLHNHLTNGSGPSPDNGPYGKIT